MIFLILPCFVIYLLIGVFFSGYMEEKMLGENENMWFFEVFLWPVTIAMIILLSITGGVYNFGRKLGGKARKREEENE